MRLFKQFVIGNLIGIAIVFVVGLLATTAHCAISTKHENNLGYVAYDHNPYMYLAATLSAKPDAVSVVDGNVNLRLDPLATYMLYDESLLLCGNPADKFEGVGEAFVLTYERVAHRTVRGIGCHTLVRVDTLKKKELQ